MKESAEKKGGRLKYRKELAKLQVELVKLQEWIKQKGLKVVVIFEGRDAAGKGGVIKRITECLNPVSAGWWQGCPPTGKRGVFPAICGATARRRRDGAVRRSWYNRAGVERVMGFCTDAGIEEFLRSCPDFERMLVRSGIILIKYWFSVSDEEQERRFQARIDSPPSGGNSAMDWSPAPLGGIFKAKDKMFEVCDIAQAPWNVVHADCKNGPLELHSSFVEPNPLQGFDAQADEVAAPAKTQRVRAPAAVRPAFCAGSVLIPAHSAARVRGLVQNAAQNGKDSCCMGQAGRLLFGDFCFGRGRRPHRLEVRTPGFHPGNTGSIPVGVAIFEASWKGKERGYVPEREKQ